MVLFLIVYIIYIIYRSVEAMHMLQQNLYNENNRYIKWVRRNYKKVFSYLDFIPIIFFIIILVTKDESLIDFFLVAGMFVYLFGIYNEYKKNKDNQNKLPLNVTGRIKRLFFTLIIILGILLYFTVMMNKNNEVVYTSVMLICLSLVLSFIYSDK